MKEICAICQAGFDDEAFVKHLRSHKIKVEDYYLQHRPKKDLYSGEPIRFKNREFYQSSLFNTRTNLVKFVKECASNLKRKAILAEVIEMRQSVKAFEYAPSTVEARTSILPTPLLFEEYGMDYNAAWKAVGAKARYDYSLSLEPVSSSLNLSIIVDTREQKPLSFPDATVVKTALKYGDYAALPSNGIVVERKSLPDLCGTLSSGYERFQREIDRAGAAKEMLIVCVETDASTLMSYNYLPHMKHIKASPEFICHRMRELCQKYPQIQFLLCKNRTIMTPTVKKLLSFSSKPLQIDLQYVFDKGLLV